MSNKSSKQLPENLRGKVIVVSATLPGAGKSYVKKAWAKALKREHYQVWNLGTTNQASDEITLTKKFQTFEKDRKTFTYKTPCTKKGGKHKTRAFVLVDEAFMLQKGHLIDLVKYYPECCFILFGDPLQFDPVTTYVLEGDNEELLLQQQAYDESVGVMIDKADLVLDIQGSHRYEQSSLLFKVLQEIRRGIIDSKLFYDFIVDRLTAFIDYTKPHIIIPFTKQTVSDYNLNAMTRESSYKLWRANTTRFETDGKLWSKGDLFEEVKFYGQTAIRNLETGSYIDLPDEEGLFDPNHKNCNFERANAVNVHKVQGATIGKQTIYIPLWDICRYVNSTKDETWTWFQKYLYVALSRARTEDQIKFVVDMNPGSVCNTLNTICNEGLDKMYNVLLQDAIQVTDSSVLAEIESVDEYLSTLVDNTRCYETDCPFIEAVKRADFGKAHKSHKAHKSRIDLSFVVSQLKNAGFTNKSKGIQKYLMEEHICSTDSYQKHKIEILNLLGE